MILDINPMDRPGQSFPAEDAEKAAGGIRRLAGLDGIRAGSSRRIRAEA